MGKTTLRGQAQTRVNSAGETEVKATKGHLERIVIFNNGSDTSFTIQDGNTVKGIVKPTGDVPRAIEMGLDFSGSLKTVVVGRDPALNWYKFDETSGSEAEDAGSEANADLTLTNMEDGDWVAGKIGSALNFDGVDEHAESDAAIITSSGSEFSICFWVNFATPATTDTLFTTDDGLMRMWQDENWLRFFCGRHGSRAVYIYYVDMTGVFTAGTWYHIAITWDGTQTAAGTAMYINGEKKEVGIILDSFNGIKTWSTEKFQIAKYMDGKIDDFRIYGEELNEEDIENLYNGGDGRSDDYVMCDVLFVYD